MLWLALAAAYVIGAIPFGYLVARRAGVADIRRHGSGNIGATNVLRVVGVAPAAVVLCLDALKGVAGVLLVRWAGGDAAWQTAGGLMAMVGHAWPFTLGWRGGRAVATGLGMLAALHPPAALVGVGVFVAVVALTRYVSLGSMLGAAAGAAAVGFGLRIPAVTVLAAAAALMVIGRHAPNIRRLLSGTEHRLGRPAGPGLGAEEGAGGERRADRRRAGR